MTLAYYGNTIFVEFYDLLEYAEATGMLTIIRPSVGAGNEAYVQSSACLTVNLSEPPTFHQGIQQSR